ncbi:LOW QUALITY PROTEIN: vacuolar lysine transporter YPQ1-like [Aristolochia californica]|uniref:LOW QUALITY PROTEIN: vacuolar lysine transporter YPQ1-like n=1 Tax=Aristolochia californica TaxID=171875 RepID=UPI0035E019A0
MPSSYCVEEKKPCLFWAERFFGDCLCNAKDKISFAFGIVTLVSWAVAEIPQIVTNCFTQSSHGVSLAFLLTWVAGDVFNLVGCLLEPATLPTQFYTALLYTITTVFLLLQTIYYDYIRAWWKSRGMKLHPPAAEEKDTKPFKTNAHESNVPTTTSALMISNRSDMYYRSARSLASSGTPTYGSYLPRSNRSTLAVQDDSSDDETFPICQSSATKPIAIPRSVGYGTFLSTSLSLPYQSKALMERYSGLSRRLLQENHAKRNMYGLWLGWLMAAIYMGGRLPQIWLNIKRGSVEGLNPLIFIFALIANITYVGSIVVRSTEWEKIKANIPWLLDAVVCVALDLFIIFQFVYYKYLQRRSSDNEDNHGVYFEAKPTITPEEFT